jgi:hypothetical protein
MVEQEKMVVRWEGRIEPADAASAGVLRISLPRHGDPASEDAIDVLYWVQGRSQQQCTSLPWLEAFAKGGGWQARMEGGVRLPAIGARKCTLCPKIDAAP